MSRKRRKTSINAARDMPKDGFFRSQIKLGDRIRTKLELNTSFTRDDDLTEVAEVVYIHPRNRFYVLKFPNGLTQTEYFRHKAEKVGRKPRRRNVQNFYNNWRGSDAEMRKLRSFV